MPGALDSLVSSPTRVAITEASMTINCVCVRRRGRRPALGLGASLEVRMDVVGEVSHQHVRHAFIPLAQALGCNGVDLVAHVAGQREADGSRAAGPRPDRSLDALN
jgi:hypothetical protein